MTTHTFEIIDTYIRPRSFMPARLESTVGTLVVRPPFEIPQGLESIVIGTHADTYNTCISHTENIPGDCSRFEISAAEGSDIADLVTLQRIGERVVRYANDPSEAEAMKRQAPFAMPI